MVRGVLKSTAMLHFSRSSATLLPATSAFHVLSVYKDGKIIQFRKRAFIVSYRKVQNVKNLQFVIWPTHKTTKTSCQNMKNYCPPTLRAERTFAPSQTDAFVAPFEQISTRKTSLTFSATNQSRNGSIRGLILTLNQAITLTQNNIKCKHSKDLASSWMPLRHFLLQCLTGSPLTAPSKVLDHTPSYCTLHFQHLVEKHAVWGTPRLKHLRAEREFTPISVW